MTDSRDKRNPIVSIPVIKRAKELFFDIAIKENKLYTTKYEELGSQITMKSLREGDNSHETLINRRFFNYSTIRLQQLFTRLSFIRWSKIEFLKKKGDEKHVWSIFAPLLIKDFHIDLSSFFDALAPVIIQVTRGLTKGQKQHLPGFYSFFKRNRKRIPQPILDAMDSTKRWWLPIKYVRDILVHREHINLVFGSPDDGILFQILGIDQKPLILDDCIMWLPNKDIIDFERYSVFILAELFIFLEELGNNLAEINSIDISKEHTGCREGDFSYLIEPLNNILSKSAPG